jgi:hypothetical protein
VEAQQDLTTGYLASDWIKAFAACDRNSPLYDFFCGRTWRHTTIGVPLGSSSSLYNCKYYEGMAIPTERDGSSNVLLCYWDDADRLAMHDCVLITSPECDFKSSKSARSLFYFVQNITKKTSS